MEKEKQSNIEYKGPGVQGKTGEKTSGSIHRFICNRGGGIHQCGQATTANLNENLSGYEH